MYQLVYNQEIISKIAQDYYKKYGLNLDDAPQANDDKNFLSKLDNTKKISELYAQIFPYIKYDNFNIYRSELKKFTEHKDFPQILKDSVLTNSDLFKTYSYNIVYLHRIAKEHLDSKTLQALEDSVFYHIKPNAVQEVQVHSVSYLLDKTSFYAQMNTNMLLSSGQSQVTEFISAVKNDLIIIEKLKIDRIINYPIIEEEPKNIQLIIINPRDKDILNTFIEELPIIFKNVLNSMTPEEQSGCKFSQHLDALHKSIDHLALSQKLGTKEKTIQKYTKI